MKTPFKELKVNGNGEHDAHTPERGPKYTTTPKTLSSTACKPHHGENSYSSPPPNRKAYQDRSPPSEFNKKTSYLFRNGIIRSQQEFLDLQ